MKKRQILVVGDERIVADDIKMRDKVKSKHNFLDYSVTKKYRKFFKQKGVRYVKQKK